MPHLARTAAEQAKIEESCVGPMIHEALDKGKPPTGLLSSALGNNPAMSALQPGLL